MKNGWLLNGSERRVDRILRHRLPVAYRVFPCVRLADVINREESEFLSREKFDFLRTAHLDFVVASRLTEPVFAVEFDGPFHDGPEQTKRDILKNHLCKAAGLPLLRIRAGDTEEHERVSLLDYMLERYVSWQREHADLEREIADHVADLSAEDVEEIIEDGGDPWLDPTIRFDFRHPFPATRLVRQRLLHEHRIEEWNGQPASPGIRFFVTVGLGVAGEDPTNEEYHRAESCAVVRSVEDPRGEPVFLARREASVRAWLRSNPNATPMTLDQLRTLSFDADALLQRVEIMWFPNLPGVWPWDIAENFSNYLALRAVEDWAREGGPAGRAER